MIISKRKALNRLLACVWGFLPLAANAQLVMSHGKGEAVSTKEASQFEVVKVGNNYQIGGIDIRDISFIGLSSANKGKVNLPSTAALQADELTVIGDGEVADVDELGSFTTSANNMVALNQDNKMVYRVFVSGEDKVQSHQVSLNATETAMSLMLPFFDSLFSGITDETLATLKRLLLELPETAVLAAAIDESIVKYGYLNTDYEPVTTALAAAYEAMAEKSGLNEAMALRSQAEARSRGGNIMMSRAAGDLGTYTEKGLQVVWKSYLKTEVNVEDDILNKSYKGTGYRCTFDIYNQNRFAYTAITVGRKMQDGSLKPVRSTFKEQLRYIVAPQRVSGFLDTYRSWGEFKEFMTDSYNLLFTKGFGFSDMHYLDEKLLDVKLDLSNKDDVLLVAGPQDNRYVMAYNVTRIVLAMVLNDLLGDAAENAGADVVADFLDYMTGSDDFMYQFMVICDGQSNNKTKEYWNLIFPQFKSYLKSEQFRDFLTSKLADRLTNFVLNKAISTITDNVNVYLSVVEKGGNKMLTVLGLTEGSFHVSVDGLDWPDPGKFTYTYDGVNLAYKVISETDRTCQIGDGISCCFTKPGTVGTFSIPSYVYDDHGNKYTVIKVGDYAFKDCQYIYIIYLEGNTITHIGKDAFTNSSLGYITLPASIRYIGEHAFSCNLKGVNVYGHLDDIELAVPSPFELLPQYSENGVVLLGTDYPEEYYTNPLWADYFRLIEGLLVFGGEPVIIEEGVEIVEE